MVQTLANWGEFLGEIAVVVSLLYVGIQVRSSVRQSRVDSYTRISELWSQWTSMVASDDETSRIYYQGTQDFDSLNAVERTRFNLIIGMYFGIFETIIVHEKSGAYDPETFRRNLNTAMQSLPAREYKRGGKRTRGVPLPRTPRNTCFPGGKPRLRTQLNRVMR